MDEDKVTSLGVIKLTGIFSNIWVTKKRWQGFKGYVRTEEEEKMLESWVNINKSGAFSSICQRF